MLELKFPEAPVPFLTLSPGLCGEDHLDIFHDEEKGDVSVLDFDLTFDLSERLMEWRHAVLSARADECDPYEIDTEGRSLAHKLARSVIGRRIRYVGLDGETSLHDRSSGSISTNRKAISSQVKPLDRPQHVYKEGFKLTISALYCAPGTFNVMFDEILGAISAADIGLSQDLAARFLRWRDAVISGIDPQEDDAGSAKYHDDDKGGLALAYALKQASPAQLIVYLDTSERETVFYWSPVTNVPVPVRIREDMTWEKDLPPISKKSPSLTLSPGLCAEDHVFTLIDDLTGVLTAQRLLLEPALVERFDAWRDAVLKLQLDRDIGVANDNTLQDAMDIDSEGEALALELAEILPGGRVRYIGTDREAKVITAPAQNRQSRLPWQKPRSNKAMNWAKRRALILSRAKNGETLYISPNFCGVDSNVPCDGLFDYIRGPCTAHTFDLSPSLVDRFHAWRDKVQETEKTPETEAALDREGLFLAYWAQWELPRRYVCYVHTDDSYSVFV